MVSNLIKSAHEVTLVAHKDPDQVFLADGGHYENSAILPLLRLAHHADGQAG